MKSVGIVICNYNKCDMVIRCIQTVLESKYQDFDIFVVDNASTDGSVWKIKQAYGGQVTLLINVENLGGSGGFNRGIREVLRKGYEYVLCLDNDVQVDENAVEALRAFLINHPDTGMAGAKVYHAQLPGMIQQMGIRIDFDKFGLETFYADHEDSDNVPNVVWCDTVAACAVMLPAKVIHEIGCMPEDNFIYFDDIEWGYSVRQAGYKVAAVGDARVLHEMGAMDRRISCFSNYYQWRNCFHFFMKYTPPEKRELMSLSLIQDFYEELYLHMYREEHAVTRTLMFAFRDALAGIRGKAAEGKIMESIPPEDKFSNLVKKSGTYWLRRCDKAITPWLLQQNPGLEYTRDYKKADLPVKLCSSILRLKDLSGEFIYVDEAYNAAIDRDDRQTIANYPFSMQLFVYLHQPELLYAAEHIYYSLPEDTTD